jgi:hypothetical protein
MLTFVHSRGLKPAEDSAASSGRVKLGEFTSSTSMGSASNTTASVLLSMILMSKA